MQRVYAVKPHVIRYIVMTVLGFQAVREPPALGITNFGSVSVAQAAANTPNSMITAILLPIEHPILFVTNKPSIGLDESKPSCAPWPGKDPGAAACR